MQGEKGEEKKVYLYVLKIFVFAKLLYLKMFNIIV